MREITTRPLTVRPGRPTVRTTFQFCATIHPDPGQSASDTLVGAAGVVLDWLEDKFPAAVPATAKAGKSFSVDEHGQTLQIVSIPEVGLWSARLMQPDAPSPYGDRDAVAGRTWTTELSLVADGTSVRAGVRVLCASLPYTQAPITLTRPRVIVHLSKRFDLRDVKPVESAPWRLENNDDVERLFSLIKNPRRSLPVFLLTQPDPQRLGLDVHPFLLDEVQLAHKLLGLGHVVTLPRDLNAMWTRMVGKTWSAFFGAVRTYHPGLNFDEDSPTNHPLALADRVLAFERDGDKAEAAFTAFLVDQALAHAATKSIDWRPCLFHADAVHREGELARNRARDDQDWRHLYEQEIAALSKRAEEADGLANSYADDVDTLTIQLGEAQDENRRLARYIDTLRVQLEAKTGRSADAGITIPSDYDALPEWVEANLAGRLLLHPRATRGLKDAKYEDVPLVYKALLVLATEYRSMRLRTAEDEQPKRAWESHLHALGLECEGSITKERAGEEGDTYFVKYPIGGTKSRFLDLHLRKGSTKDDRVCLRIYFFWDGDTDRVVVGWLPSHLDTRAT